MIKIDFDIDKIIFLSNVFSIVKFVTIYKKYFNDFNVKV